MGKIELKELKGGIEDKIVRSIILGPSGSGKTQLLFNLLRSVRNNLGIVYVFCGTAGVNVQYRAVTHELCIFEGFNETLCEQIVDTHSKFIKSRGGYNENNPLHNMAIVLDDVFGQLSEIKGSNLLQKLMSEGRHIGISIYILAQAATKKIMTPEMRPNFTHICVLPGNHQFLEPIRKEVMPGIFKNTDAFVSVFKKLKARCMDETGETDMTENKVINAALIYTGEGVFYKPVRLITEQFLVGSKYLHATLDLFYDRKHTDRNKDKFVINA